MSDAAAVIALLPVGIAGYAYIGYPLALRAAALLRAPVPVPPEPAEWPALTVTVPAYNAESSIRGVLQNILATDYPADRRQIVVISDASTDRTDSMVRELEDEGVELVRLPVRRGKTAAEGAAARVARGSIIVNVDAGVRLLPHSLRALVRAFGDPSVGVASGRDVTAADDSTVQNAESGYVGYEMWLRGLESRLGGIVGASGCFFGIRRELVDLSLPDALSRDFASALIARDHGYRSVSVPDAVCLVPQTRGLEAELERKARTMARGLETLFYFRRLMNPWRFGGFAFRLISHKLCRWLVSLSLPVAALAVLWWSAESETGRIVLAALLAGAAMGVAAMRWPRGRLAPRLMVIAGYLLASNVAGALAWSRFFTRQRTAVWQPTSRPA
ncbi:MAG TPA: glycosyltransferase [Gemmatimonadaceae bacterium]|nr:glycosyltransferase [Gemmatimonadaceae bacterium]